MNRVRNTHMWHKPPFSVRALNAALMAVAVITVICPLVIIAYCLVVK
ncbi:hypothetical protein [Alteromonas stellipolaris]|nr:hypothetical protein [Alteromonas stellipolaris]